LIQRIIALALLLLAYNHCIVVLAFCLIQRKKMFSRKTIALGFMLCLWSQTIFANPKFTDLDEQVVEIKSPAILNFWATWCAPCIKELPDLEKLGQNLEPKAIVYLVNFGESTETIKAFKAKKPKLFGTHTVMIKDSSMSGLKAFGLRGVPTTVLIDSTGKTVEKIQGMKDWGSEKITAEIKAKIFP